MTPATILPEAAEELWVAAVYYDKRAEGLGRDFAAEMERSVQSIQEAPLRWPERADGTRRYLAQRFPFMVVYTYLEDRVWILAFAHCKRKPEYWSSRV